MAQAIFATIEQLPSKRWRVRYTGPDGASATRRTPSTPGSTPRRGRSRCAARSTRTSGTPPTTTPKSDHFRRLRGPLAGQPQVAGRPIKARTREHYSAILDEHLLPAFGTDRSPRSSPRTCARGTRRHSSTGRRCARTPTRCCARSWRSAVNDEIVDANPARIVGAGRAKRVHKIRPGNGRRARRADRGDARAAAAHGHAGVLVCAAIRRDRRIAPRRHRSVRRGDPHPPRRGADQGRVIDHHAQSRRRVRDVDDSAAHHPADRGAPGETCWQRP